MTDKYFRIIVDSKTAESSVKVLDGAMVAAGRSADTLSAAASKVEAEARKVGSSAAPASESLRKLEEKARAAANGALALDSSLKVASAAAARLDSESTGASAATDKLAASTAKTAQGARGIDAATRPATSAIQQLGAASGAADSALIKSGQSVAALGGAATSTGAAAKLAAASVQQLGAGADAADGPLRGAAQATEEMSAALSRTGAAARSAVDVSRQLGASVGSADSAMRAAAQASDLLAESTVRAGSSVEDAVAAVQDLGGEISTTNDSAAEMTFTLNRLYAAVVSVVSASQIIQYADAWQEVQGKIRQTTSSQEELVDVTKKLFEVSNATRTPIEATVDLYAQLRRSTESLGLSQEKVIEITKTIGNSMLASGGNADSMRSAIIQLGQGLASGALRGEEFNSIAEQAPLIMAAISAETGMAAGELRKFAATGGITTELLVRALENYSGAAQKAADAMGATFGQSLTEARNNAVAFVGASAQLTEAVGAAGGAIVYISQNLKIFQSLVEVVAAVIAARLVGAAVAWIAKTNLMISAQILANATLAAAAGAHNAHVLAMARATVAANALAVATRGAQAAMALVGGPAGAAVLIGAAIYYFATQSESAAEATDRLSQAVRAQSEAFDQLSTKQAKTKALDVAKSMAESQAAVDELSGRVRGLKSMLESEYNDATAQTLRESLTRTEASLETAERNTTLFKIQLEQLDVAVAKATSGPKELAGAFDRLSESLATGVPADLFAASPEKPAPKKLPEEKTSSDTLKAGLDTAQMEAEVALREAHFKRLRDIEKNSADISLDTLRAGAAERLAQEQIDFQKSQSLIEINRAKVAEDQTASKTQKAAQMLEFDAQEALQSRTHQQNLLDIKFEAAQRERDFVGQRAAEVAAASGGISAETEALQRDLAFRQQMQSQHASVLFDINASAIDQEKAQIEIKIAEDTFRESEQFTLKLERLAFEQQAILENESLSAEQKNQLALQYQAQEAAIKAGHQQTLTEIDQSGKSARESILKQELSNRLSTAGGAFADMASIAQGHSKKSFEIAKVGSLSVAAVKGGEAAVDAWTYGMAHGGPWAAAGLTAASLLKTGAQISQINGMQYGGGGASSSGGGAAPPLPSGGGSSLQPGLPSTASTTTAPPEQKKSFDLRVEPGLYSHTQVIEFAKMMAGSDSAIGVLSAAQSDAMRRGASL